MYTNETPLKSVRVYPNRDAIKQMALKSVCNNVQTNSLTQHIPKESQTYAQSSSKESQDCLNDDSSVLLLLIMVMFFCPEDNDSTLFSIILAMLFIS